MCTVFAESEVISLIGQGEKKENIAFAVVDSIVRKVAAQANRMSEDRPMLCLTGGLCECSYISEALTKELGMEVKTDPQSRYAGAIGAALGAVKKGKNKRDNEGDTMLIEIDFNSDEALYVQLQNQIIMGIATATIQEGESLPSVRQLADTVGINMHTVNKAYSILKQEGFIQLDRRRGAVIAIDADKAKAYAEVKRALRIALAKGSLKNVSREEVHEMVDELFDEYGGKE